MKIGLRRLPTVSAGYTLGALADCGVDLAAMQCGASSSLRLRASLRENHVARGPSHGVSRRSHSSMSRRRPIVIWQTISSRVDAQHCPHHRVANKSLATLHLTRLGGGGESSRQRQSASSIFTRWGRSIPSPIFFFFGGWGVPWLDAPGCDRIGSARRSRPAWLSGMSCPGEHSAPATAELLKGFRSPPPFAPRAHHPTGAAIMATSPTSFGPLRREMQRSPWGR